MGMEITITGSQSAAIIALDYCKRMGVDVDEDSFIRAAQITGVFQGPGYVVESFADISRMCSDAGIDVVFDRGVAKCRVTDCRPRPLLLQDDY